MIEGLDDPAPRAASQRAHQGAGAGAAARAWACWREPRFLQVDADACRRRWWPTRMAVQEANREYQERALAREGLRRMYIGTLTLSLFLAVFGAVLLAVLLGNQLARPLLLLAAGVREVAAGRPVAQAGAAGQGRTRRPDALLRRDDAAAGRRARGGGEEHGRRSTPRAPTCRPSWTTSPPA